MSFLVANDEKEDKDKRRQTVLDIVSDLCNLIIVNIITSAKSLLNVIGVDKDTALHFLTCKMDKK
jgi:hypothetical protein